MMMRKIALACLTIFFLAASGVSVRAQTVTAEDYARAEKMLASNAAKYVDRADIRPVRLSDGRFWYRVLTAEGSEYVLVDPSTGGRKVFTALDQLRREIGDAAPGDRVPTPSNGIASPDGNKVAFIRDWNLWVRDAASGKETQLTSDGVENFGYATDNAGWRKSDRPVLLWSPDSKKIATYRQDQRHVSEMYLVTTNVGAPKLQAWKYPLPEDADIIRIHRVIIDVEAGSTIPLKLPPDPRRGTLCDDISCTGKFDDNEWSPDSSKLAFVSTGRDHKEAVLRIADAKTGEVRDVLKETVKTQYESGQGAINWRYLPGSNEIIWYSERDDWGHLYLYGLDGKLKRQITKGEFVVTRLRRVDEKNRRLYFEALGREAGRDPYFTHFYSIGFDGGDLRLLTPEDGDHRVWLPDEGDHFVDEYSKPDVPSVTVLRDLSGRLVATLEKADITRLRETGWTPPTPFTVKDRNGKWDLYGLMFTPRDLDRSKKYPVVNYIYPGPQGGGVGRRSFTVRRADHQALAELGFVVVVLDGTCNPDRSKSFHDACYGNMADNTLEDQIAGLRQLAERHPYIDLERVGVWGHSGGGFATAAAMFRYPDFYKVGVSQSGNHDNRNYEDDWGERYIGLLEKGSGGRDNYDAQANQNYAKDLKGKLLLTHGGLDDNVPPYNTYLVVEALIEANKDFDLIIFPNERHGYRGQSGLYMTRRRWDYFVRHLLGAEPPEEYRIGGSERDPRLPE